MSCNISNNNSPHVIINDDEEEDDEFDWEAAVKAIDVACQKRAFSSTFASTSAPAPSFISTTTSNPHKPNKPTRQSTLDSFIQTKNQSTTNCQLVGGSDRIEEIGDGNLETNNLGCYCQIDLEAAKTWIYPVNIPLRDYQLSITKTALFANTLVALPTGLGKTLIAAVVMYNYFRWFPEGKIVFAAPSRPLVLQQIEACHNTVGIPQEWTIDLTGQTSPSKRAYLWKAKRVFFVTPQVLEKDIQSGTCLMRHLVCLVIDEAHRASGNYSYCVAVRELMAVPLQFRILALTATPGSKQQTIQKVIDNLQISKLEYRTEADNDVSPYVHNRKLELIKVAMGKDAVEINDMILEAIRPFVNKLTSFGVHLNRDSQTLSPCDLLNTRDIFRQAPPQDLSHLKYGEVEGCFGVLITLYHVRKLLSSHGIRPAYEMLEEKLKQGSFARLMNKNEVIWKTKALMQQSLSRGAPSPKLSKLREILIDHFKTNDSKNSRVIIFSNFRGSVRDIMNSLSSIGESVKATEFIGQSSGKVLKGQTQKIQQAVLQKFRAGGYNIIVATSIGEEGLDIMEVDLVICFDSNVSPLRMIQRMGRTGRKHDGRVVVLACEGSELKGYLRKQANSKAVKKHMHNGGINSFDFHSSPRMIPHICKPEVQFVEFSIEQFVPRGKKVKDDSFDDQAFKDKLSDAETQLIAKYFSSSGEHTWKPSLIAFPYFQAFPSRVHNVMHSFKTRMLIGTMQHMQGLSFSMDDKVPPCEVLGMTSSYQCVGAESLAQHDRSEKDFEATSGEIASPSAKQYRSDSPSLNCSIHFSLFGDTYVSVKPSGTVSIAYVPSLPFVKETTLCKSTEENSTELLNIVKKKSSLSTTSFGGHCELSRQSNLANPADSNSINNCFAPGSRFCILNSLRKAAPPGVEEVVLTPSPKRICINSEVIIVERPASTRRNLPILLANESTSDVKDIEMSPRLTNMIEKGVVPESPLAENGDHSYNGLAVSRNSSSKCVNYQSVPSCSREVHSSEISKDSMLLAAKLPSFGLRRQLLSPVHAPFAFGNGLPIKNLGTEKSEDDKICTTAGAVGEESGSPINGDIRTPVQIHTTVNARGNSSGSPMNAEPRTPFINLTNSCSSDWHLSSGEQTKSTQHAPKFRRLRKYVECSKTDSSEIMKDVSTGHIPSIAGSTTRANRVNHARGKQKMDTKAKAFIEEEAEVSADAEVSDDEEEDMNNSSNDDSFIDDRINPTVESTEAEAIRSDMMAIYRRSLLSQSPMESPPCCSTGLNLGSMHHRIETDETGSCSSGKISHLAQTPQVGLQPANQSAVRSFSFCNTDLDKNPRVSVLSETCAATREERKLESRKRKLSFHQVGYDPETSLQPQRFFHSEETKPDSNELNGDVFYDDQFYEGLDLDALEAQATKLLKHKSESSMDKKQCDFPNPVTEKGPELSDSPSFDLGI